MATSTVTIYSEARRGVLVRALWNAAVQALGNNEDEFVWLDDEEEFADTRVDLAARVAAYNRWVSEMEAVQDAALGDSVELWGDVGDRVLSLRRVIADSPEHLLNAEPTERARILELFDAAYTLLPAEAVS